jgi:hypothetical protein
VVRTIRARWSVPPTASSLWRNSRTTRTNHERWSSRLTLGDHASEAARCLRGWAHTGAGFGRG